MKCFTNQNNPTTLKILIAANFGQKNVDLQYVNIREWKSVGMNRLPVFEMDDGIKLFSSNAAARYLFMPNDSISDNVDLWLEVESSAIRPALMKCNLVDLNDSSILNIFHYVDFALQDEYFLTGDEISVADIAVWSSLFGVLTQQSIVSKICTNYQNIIVWFERIRNLEPVKAALTKWGSKIGMEVIQAYAETLWCSTTFQTQISKSLVNEVETTKKLSHEVLKEVEDAWWNRKSSRPKPQISTGPILPKVGEKNILVTSALPYVNNVPHLGNIIGCVLSADVFSRYCKLRNWNTLYIGGTDEYGTATETKALEEGLTPQQICDKYFVVHNETYSWFNISFDYFGRTTTEQQKLITQELFMELYTNNFTSIESTDQLKCLTCDRFLADRFVEGTCPNCKFEDARGDQCDGCGHLINAIELIQPRCKLCKFRPVIQSSDQIFLDLPKIEPVLQKWISESSPNWTHNARTITNTWLKDGLKSRCITRDLKWGTPVPLPGFENKVFYVWFDAPIGYLSITACYTDQWRKWWQPSKDTPVSYYQFMAKDNVPFHSVMFPATLLAINKNYLLVNHIMATEYLNYEDGKFSKSRGIGVFGTDAKNTGIPADVFRFYLLYVRPESQDSSFSWMDFATKHNTELLNNIGNFVNRALVFTEKYFNGVIPALNMNEDDFTLLALVTQELQAYNEALEKVKIRDGIKYILNISRHGNQYMQNQKPWVLINGSGEEILRAGTVIGVCCNIVCLLAVVIEPYMPYVSKTIREQLNAPEDVMVLTNEVNMLLPEGHKIGKPAPMFLKIVSSAVDLFKANFAGRGKSSSPPKVENVPLESFLTIIKKARNITSLNEMQIAVEEQASLIRLLKSEGVNKSQWMPHVNALQDMRKQLEELKMAIDDNTSEKISELKNENSDIDKETEILELEQAIKEKGDNIRKLKAKEKNKDVWEPLVKELLELKGRLTHLKPTFEISKKAKKK